MTTLICRSCGAVNQWDQGTDSELYGYWLEQHPSNEPGDIKAPRSEKAAAALTYAAAGWAVFPVWWPVNGHCACPRGAACPSPAKHPMTGNGVNDASSDPAKILHWWGVCPEANIGLPAGGNDLAILDIDDEGSFETLLNAITSKGRKFPDTLTQITGSGKKHLVFTAPADGVKTAAPAIADLPGIDTRGRGGYVVAAPSQHISGGTYVWQNLGAEIAPWPSSLSNMMAAKKKQPPVRIAAGGFTIPSQQTGAGYLDKALEGERDRILNAPRPANGMPGGRNNATNTAAFNLGTLVGAGMLPEGHVRDQLVSWAITAGLDPIEAMKTVDSGLTAGKAQPRVKAAA